MSLPETAISGKPSAKAAVMTNTLAVTGVPIKTAHSLLAQEPQPSNAKLSYIAHLELMIGKIPSAPHRVVHQEFGRPVLRKAMAIGTDEATLGEQGEFPQSRPSAVESCGLQHHHIGARRRRSQTRVLETAHSPDTTSYQAEREKRYSLPDRQC